MRACLALLVFLAASLASAQPVVQDAAAPRWISDPHGCRMWDPGPLPEETIVWSGACVAGYGQGHGTLEWYSRGRLYETDTADFAHGKLNGHGVLSYADGTRFDGQFREQKPNGKGTYSLANGEVFSGEWTEGCFAEGKRKINFNTPPEDCDIAS